MKRDANDVTVPGVEGDVRIQRLAHGFPRITAKEEVDLSYGLGYAHGRDRQMQMWLLKLIGHGKASECLKADDDLIEADKFMRWLNLAGDAADESQHLSEDLKATLDAYCKGVNDAVLSTGTPFEFKLVGYRPDAWTPVDALLMSKMIGFVGLAQTQGEAEKYIIQILHSGLDPARVKELFPTIQEEISEEFVELIQKINLVRPIIPSSVSWHDLLPRFSASNNWAIASRKTASGSGILCGDPHLGLQLPSVWYLAVLSGNDDYLMGATVPGLPAVAIGRSPRMAWSATYGTSDVCDYFIEEVKDGAYRRGDTWLPLAVREETIIPKKKAPITMRVYETAHGILEGEPSKDGYYLSYAWTGKQEKGTAAQSLENIFRIGKAETVEEAMDYFAGLTFAPFNWVFADRVGNIGYQLGGLVPKQPDWTSGLLPYRGWDKSQDWDGMVDPHLYPRSYNLETGILVTANQDLNHLGEVQPMKLPVSNYRSDRITNLLQEKDVLTVEDMKRIHYDRYSLQAEAFMAIIEPLLPDSESGRILRGWNLCYEADSLGATLFEQIYQELVMLVFGENGLGREVMEHFVEGTPLFAILHGNFDRILLSQSSVWFGGQSRESIYKGAIERGLTEKVVPHGETRRMYAQHLFLGGKLPRFLGFDYPLEHIGSRSTVAQAQMFKTGTRAASFGATFRMICDFGDDTLHTNIAGGASDRRFSRYYTSGLGPWESGEYEVFKP